jgi:hypothetical protein
MLDLADVAGDVHAPSAVEAYRLSRCAEVTYQYVARDKHFDWEATVRAITGLCPSSGLAILSRWRDRNFGSEQKLLPVAVSVLVDHAVLDPRSALALIGFRGWWNYTQLLKNALNKCRDQSEKEILVAQFYRYLTLEEQDPKTWHALRDLLISHNVVISELDDRCSVYAATSRGKNGDRVAPNAMVQMPAADTNWTEVFAGLDLTVANDVATAYERFRTTGPPYYVEEFFKEARIRLSGVDPNFETTS